MITIGASIFLRGVAQIVFDKRFHSLPPLFGADPIQFGGAAILPQSLVVLAGAARHRGPALAVHRPHAARQGGDRDRGQPARGAARRHRHAPHRRFFVRGVGGDRRHRRHSGHADHADQLRRRHPAGAQGLCGGDARRHRQRRSARWSAACLLGLLEAFSAGYLSSSYKDAVAFLVILVVLFAMPQGLFGRAKSSGCERARAARNAVAAGDRRSRPSSLCCRCSFPRPITIAIAALVFIFALAVVGLNLLMGFAGQVSLGHAGFLGIGAYAVAIGPTHLGLPSWLASSPAPRSRARSPLWSAGRSCGSRDTISRSRRSASDLLIAIVLTNEARWTGGPTAWRCRAGAVRLARARLGHLVLDRRRDVLSAAVCSRST